MYLVRIVVRFSSLLYLQKSILLKPKPISMTLYFHTLRLHLAYWLIYRYLVILEFKLASLYANSESLGYIY